MKHIERLRKHLGVSGGAAGRSPAKKAKTQTKSSESPTAESTDQSDEHLAVKTEPVPPQFAGAAKLSPGQEGHLRKRKRKRMDASKDEVSAEEYV